jgi:hypothetical protein
MAGALVFARGATAFFGAALAARSTFTGAFACAGRTAGAASFAGIVTGVLCFPGGFAAAGGASAFAAGLGASTALTGVFAVVRGSGVDFFGAVFFIPGSGAGSGAIAFAGDEATGDFGFLPGEFLAMRDNNISAKAVKLGGNL